jgi:tetratricopeptide (TPR) repeat protein
LKAGAMLEALWKAQPSHPGLAHYIIHSYDVPALAPRALAAAHEYGRIAPDAPHALHMPSHTFTRVGAWQESIDTNILSAAAARRLGAVAEELHAGDYEVYAYLQTAQDAGARRIVASLDSTRRRFNPDGVASAAPGSAGLYALAAMPARYALERGAWAEAAVLEVHPSRVPYADAMTHFARALGAARSRDAALMRAAAGDLDALKDAAAALSAAREYYWAEQVTIQWTDASAWTAFAAGRRDEALAQLRDAVSREDRTEKSAITPGPLAPARELLGEMLLELKQPKEALAQFEQTLRKEPNRFRSLAGAVAAASEAGQTAVATRYARELLTVCARADRPGRPELAAARRASGRPPGQPSL